MVKILVIILIGIIWVTKAEADIYRYVDSRGVIHFTNVPNHPAYRLYMREGKTVRQPSSDSSSPAKSKMDPSDPLISHMARRHGLDQSLVRAVIKVESDFNPMAISSKGARGLMQLMPATAKDLGVRDSFDPVENVEGGVRYLRMLLDFFDGDLPLALAAYNAGKETVIQYGGIPPYQETREYVSKVLYYYDLFRKKGSMLASR